MPTPRKTPLRTVGVPDDLWNEAQEIARQRNERVSDVIRDCLRRYVRRHRPEGRDQQ